MRLLVLFSIFLTSHSLSTSHNFLQPAKFYHHHHNPPSQLQESIEVTPPLPTADLPPPPPKCTLYPLRHSFANTMGHPPVTVTYTPPLYCPPPWSHVVLHLSGVVSGDQYDRVAGVWLAGAEILRTSTPEPFDSGTFWNVRKDITRYSSLLRHTSSLSMMLENMVNDVFTGIIHVNLTLLFYKGDDGVLRENRCRKLGLGLGFGGFEPQPAELVIPVTAEGNGGYWFRIENESHLGSKSVMIPRNARKIVLELYVSFHGDDEFWYSNPPTRYIVANNLTTGRGNGAFREVFVRIDGNYVASEIPLPVVFSGGINPLFWKPVVAFGAFNMPSYDFDLTPFMGSLLDGKSHNFELGVAHTLQFWLLDANLHVWLERGSYKVEAKLSFYQPPNFLETWVYRFKHLDGLFQIITQRSSVATGWVSVSCGNLTTTIARRIGFRNSIMFQRDGTYKVVSRQAKVRTDMMVMSDEGMLIARRKFKGKYPLNIITSALTGEDIDTSVIIT